MLEIAIVGYPGFTALDFVAGLWVEVGIPVTMVLDGGGVRPLADGP